MDSIMSLLTILLIFLVFAIIILLFVAWYMSYKNKHSISEDGATVGTTTKVAKEYTKKSIFQYMQFDKIEDNMIVQDEGKRYLMVIECEGINYDLMSHVEKTAVEAGFVQFLNTLRHPIQIYTQTRTINISESLSKYNEKLEITKKELDTKQAMYARLIKADNYNEKQADALSMEILRLKNLYEYGSDVIDSIQKTSQNKNVLRKHYYIIVPYYSAELGGDLLDEEERKSMIFSELYTRAQSLIRTLSACSIKSRVLNSNELVELLYIAYNRDDSDIFSVQKAIRSGYNELFSTAPDVLDKKMQAIDEKIEKEALKLAKETISVVRAEKERKIKKKEQDFEKLVQKMAEDMLRENQKYVGKDVTEKSIQRIRKTQEEGGDADEQEKERTRITNTAE